ncbi:hypothetical protein STEG23_037730 [Scotinomys teguina]
MKTEREAILIGADTSISRQDSESKYTISLAVVGYNPRQIGGTAECNQEGEASEYASGSEILDKPIETGTPEISQDYLYQKTEVAKKKEWNLRCPSTEEWIRKMWFIYTMEYYAAEKSNDIMKFAGKWMELENVILSEIHTPKPVMVAEAYNPSSQKEETGKSDVQDHLHFHSDFKASLNYGNILAIILKGQVEKNKELLSYSRSHNAIITTEQGRPF